MTFTNTTQNRDNLNKAIPDRIITAYDGDGKVVVDTTSTAGRIVLTGLHPFQPGKPVLVDVYFGTSPDFPVGGSVQTPQIIKQKNVSSVVVQTVPKTRYYWAVDPYCGNATVALDGAVTDDGFLLLYTTKWSVVSEPSPGAATLAHAKTEDTTVALGVTWQYVLKLEAFDGEYTGSDTITINAYANSCEAAKSLPGDLNGDCVVNDADLAILQAHWLQCNALDCNDVKK